MERLKDKVAVITGGANGIGKATAQKFITEGAQVAIWDIVKEKGEETAKELGNNTKFYQVDTTSFDQVEKAAQQTHQDFGKIDILINNAGITQDATLAKMSIEQWQKVLDVNLNGVFYCTKAISPFYGGASLRSHCQCFLRGGNLW